MAELLGEPSSGFNWRVYATLLHQENTELRRLLQEVTDNVNAFTVHPEAIPTFRGDKIKRGSWIYFRRALYNRIVAALSSS